MVPVEEFSYKGTTFLVECKEHINRVAGPGARNYIIRGLRAYGDEVELPESIEKDPVTSFMPSCAGTDRIVYPGVRMLFLPKYLGRFLEKNDIFPDLEKLEVDPDNRIFSTDGRMLYKDEGRELWLSLSAGDCCNCVTVPEKVQHLGAFSFTGSSCEEIVFENQWIEADESSFDNSVWLKSQGLAAYVGNMLYRINTEGCRGKCVLCVDKKTKRIHPYAFKGFTIDGKLKLSVPSDMDFSGFTKSLIMALKNMPAGVNRKSSSLITVSIVDAEGIEKEIPIPLSLDSNGMELSKKILDYKEDYFDELFERIADSKEKLTYALFASSFMDTEVYLDYIKSNQQEALTRAIEVLDEKALGRLVKKKIFDSGALISMLPQLQSKGMVSSVAGILIALNGN